MLRHFCFRDIYSKILISIETKVTCNQNGNTGEAWDSSDNTCKCSGTVCTGTQYCNGGTCGM